MEWVHVISWLTFLVASGRVLAFMCEPPCTTFSIMRRPPLRSRLCPFGFRPRENQTHNGNLLCQRSRQRMQNDAIGLLEKPFTSLMKHMPSYKALLAKDTVFEVRTDSCMFGSIHQKSFALLGFGLDPEPFIRRCDKQHQHVKVEGAYTKASATYTKELAEKIASSFETAIIKKKQELRDDGNLPKGLENQLINSVALESEWKVEEAWTFRGNSHINIKELASVSRLATSLARQGKPIRTVCLADSFVISSAVSKGRSSSRGLTPLLRRLNSTMCACDLYINLPFVPTRHNPSDDPTRDVVIRQPLLYLACIAMHSSSCQPSLSYVAGLLIGFVSSSAFWGSDAWISMIGRSIADPVLLPPIISLFRLPTALASRPRWTSTLLSAFLGRVPVCLLGLPFSQWLFPGLVPLVCLSVSLVSG